MSAQPQTAKSQKHTPNVATLSTDAWHRTSTSAEQPALNYKRYQRILKPNELNDYDKKPKDLTAQDIADLQTDLLSFTRYLFYNKKGSPFQVKWHHKLICEALERVFIGDTTRLIINIPPRYSKTELILNFIAWTLGIFPDSEYILSSYTKRLASKSSSAVRTLVSHPAYQAVFNSVNILVDSRAKDEWSTDRSGCVYAAGAEGTITGYGAGKARRGFGGAIIIDDPHKPNEALSDVERNNVISWFSNTVESRTNSPDTPIIVVMQRLHQQDLSGFLLEGNNGEEWQHLKLPALDDYDNALWPDKHTSEKLKTMERTKPYDFAGQYMQTPIAKGGTLFKEDYWQYYDQAPSFKLRKLYIDSASKTGKQNDFTVIQHWGISKNNHAYLLDQVRGKFEAPELLKIVVDYYNNNRRSYKGALTAIHIEDKSSGIGLIQQLKQEGLPARPIQTGSRKKEERADSVIHSIGAGLVHLPTNARFLPEMLAELAVFPYGKHDDQVDTLVYAVEDLLLNKRTYNIRNLTQW